MMIPESFVVVDIETTGASRSDPFGHVIEVGAVFVAEGRIAGSMSRLIMPTDPRFDQDWSWKQSHRIHKIPPAEIRKFGVPEAEAAADIRRNLDRFAEDHGDHAIYAHNSSYESRWLSGEPWNLDKWRCSYRLAKKLIPDAESHKLGALALRFDVDVGTAHRAEADCIATAKILLAMRGIQ